MRCPTDISLYQESLQLEESANIEDCPRYLLKAVISKNNDEFPPMPFN